MSRGRPMAPTLWGILDWYTTTAGGNYGPKTASREARRELRALESVARAAKRASLEVLAVAREARNTHIRELDGDRIGRLLEDSDYRMGRALARLRSLSRPARSQSKKGARE